MISISSIVIALYKHFFFDNALHKHFDPLTTLKFLHGCDKSQGDMRNKDADIPMTTRQQYFRFYDDIPVNINRGFFLLKYHILSQVPTNLTRNAQKNCNVNQPRDTIQQCSLLLLKISQNN